MMASSGEAYTPRCAPAKALLLAGAPPDACLGGAESNDRARSDGAWAQSSACLLAGCFRPPDLGLVTRCEAIDTTTEADNNDEDNNEETRLPPARGFEFARATIVNFSEDRPPAEMRI